MLKVCVHDKADASLVYDVMAKMLPDPAYILYDGVEYIIKLRLSPAVLTLLERIESSITDGARRVTRCDL